MGTPEIAKRVGSVIFDLLVDVDEASCEAATENMNALCDGASPSLVRAPLRRFRHPASARCNDSRRNFFQAAAFAASPSPPKPP
jgi:hypothetical protein